MDFYPGPSGPVSTLGSVVSNILGAGLLFLLFAGVVVIGVLLVRYLLVATKAAEIYVRQNEPRGPAPTGGAAPADAPAPAPAAQPAAEPVTEPAASAEPSAPAASPTSPATTATTAVPDPAAPTTGAARPAAKKPAAKPRTPKTPPPVS